MKMILMALGVVSLVALLVIFVSPPRFPRSVRNVHEFEQYLSRLVSSKQPPGISLAVIKDGEIIYTHSAGKADRTGQAKVSSQTLFHWWSMTKVATAVAIMQLQEQGLLEIEKPVWHYLPDLSARPAEDPLKQITVEQVLRHTAGLPDMIPDMIGWLHYEDIVYDQTELFQGLLSKYGKLKYEPDQKSAYSNFGYLVLGAVIESVSGQSYEDYVLEHVLEPAGMNLTDFIYTSEMGENEAGGSHPLLSIYTPMLPFLVDMKALVSEREGSVYWFKRMYLDVTPSSGLIGSVEDAAKFMLAYMHTENLLTGESRNDMLPRGEQPTERPLGWSEFNMQERLWVQHRGGGPGFATIMRIYPQEALGIVVMANGTNLPSEKIVNSLANLFYK